MAINYLIFPVLSLFRNTVCSLKQKLFINGLYKYCLYNKPMRVDDRIKLSNNCLRNKGTLYGQLTKID